MAVDSRLAVLTRAGAGFGIRYLKGLAAEGVTPGLLVVEETPFAKRWGMAKHLARRIGWPDALRYNIGFWWPLCLRWLTRGRLYPTPDYNPFADRLLITQDINATEVVAALSGSGIRRVVLAQSGIVRKGILGIPKLWIVNCHPSLLPAYRGVDVVKWALLERAPLGVTLHLVDAGVDTGAILEARRVAPRPDDTPESVEDRVIANSLDLLLDAGLRGPDAYTSQTVFADKGQQYYLMPFKERARLEREWPKILAHYLSEERHAATSLR
jgi:hypothetical protein